MIELRLYQKDLRGCQYVMFEDVDISDVAVTIQDVTLAHRVIYVHPDGRAKIMKCRGLAERKDDVYFILERPSYLHGAINLDDRQSVLTQYLTLLDLVFEQSTRK